MARFRKERGFFPQRQVGRGKSSEDHPGGECWRELSCHVTPAGGTMAARHCFALTLSLEWVNFQNDAICSSRSEKLSRFLGSLAATLSPPEQLSFPRKKTAKVLSNSFTFFKVYWQISSPTSLKKLNTYRKPADACINQVTVFSNKRVTADTTMFVS